jgi:hypothetical protein
MRYYPRISLHELGEMIGIVSAPAEIRTGHLPNTSQKCYQEGQLTRWIVH